MTEEKFLKLKTVRRAISKYGNINHDNMVEILRTIDVFKSDKRIQDLYYQIAVMGILGHSIEIFNAIDNRINRPNKKFGVNLQNYCLVYGETCGKILYDLWVKDKSDTMRIKSSSEYLKIKFGEDGYKEYLDNRSKKTSITKLQNNKNRNCREDSPLCKDYYWKLGISDNTYIEQKIFEAKQKSWVFSYDKELRDIRFLKQAKTRKDNIANGVIPKSAGYSKQANSFFSKVLFKLDREICEKVITQITMGKEYWVRDIDDKNKYYFVDFCIPNMLAVEFHGNAYHPKSPTDPNYRAYLFGDGMNTEDKYNYDRKKQTLL